MRQGRGFTLIELLVVVAIIAILAAILFPVFLRAKERARETTCKSNMRQIAIAYQNYVNDWVGAFPDQSSVGFAYKPVYTNELGFQWIAGYAHRYMTETRNAFVGGRPAGMAIPLRPYIRSLGVFKCPSEWRTTDMDGFGLYYGTRSTYFIKHALCYYANWRMRPVRESEVKYPTKATLMYEEQWHNTEGRPYLWDKDAYPDPAKRPAAKRVNAIFLDLHVGYIGVPFHPISGYDPNWYFYSGDGSTWGHFADLTQGARDVP